MDIGSKLKSKRTQLGWTQEQLASQLGVARQTVANWEKGKTYPDIGSILKLSDLYNVSLDELLKEDSQMKHHIERTAAVSGKLWDNLFITAVLLLPVSMLLSHAHWTTAGIAAELLGLFLLLLVLTVRWKLSEEKIHVLWIGLFFWAVFVAPVLIGLFVDRERAVLGFSFEYLFLGILLLYSYGSCFQTKLAFLLTLGLYFGTPVYISVSASLPSILENGITSTASSNPFGTHYRVQEIIYQKEQESIPTLITLDADRYTLILNHTTIGTFTKAETDPGAIRSEWTLIPTGDPDGRVHLSSLKTNADDIILTYYTDNSTAEYTSYDTLWQLRLAPLDDVSFLIETQNSHSSLLMDWYPPELLNGWEQLPPGMLLESPANAFIIWDSISTLDITEEYYHNGIADRTQYQLIKDKRGYLPLPQAIYRRYPKGEQYAVYRISYEGGEYLFKIQYP